MVGNESVGNIRYILFSATFVSVFYMKILEGNTQIVLQNAYSRGPETKIVTYFYVCSSGGGLALFNGGANGLKYIVIHEHFKDKLTVLIFKRCLSSF